MLTDKQRWWAEWGLDLAFTVVVGWFLLGAFAAAILMPMVTDPKDPGEIAKALPVLVQAAVTYGCWKLMRSFNWLKGVPPKGG
jgi:hypothetical protein